jgi:hypothetical protein
MQNGSAAGSSLIDRSRCDPFTSMHGERSMKQMLIAGVVVAGLLAGCGTMEQKKDAAKAEQQAQDASFCRRTGHAEGSAAFSDCMGQQLAEHRQEQGEKTKKWHEDEAKRDQAWQMRKDSASSSGVGASSQR